MGSGGKNRRFNDRVLGPIESEEWSNDTGVDHSALHIDSRLLTGDRFNFDGKPAVTITQTPPSGSVNLLDKFFDFNRIDRINSRRGKQLGIVSHMHDRLAGLDQVAICA
jgi:hypothetical protein